MSPKRPWRFFLYFGNMVTKLSTICRLTGLALLAAVSLNNLVAFAGEATTVSSVLQPFVDHHSMAGAVTLVASKEKVISLEAVGYADVAAKKPMRTDSLFWIASQSKPMTATALMMLVDEGRVNLDDPVEKYLPEFKGQMVAQEQDSEHVLLKRSSHPITVREILSHASGLPFLSAIETRIDTHPLREAVISYALSPLKSQPGTQFSYSNAGINTAGRIVEVVSGMPYEQFMQSRLFRPLGMKDTTFWPTKKQLQRLAKSYQSNAAKTDLEETTVSQLTYPLDNRSRGVSPAGGYFSTAHDMGRFCQMILNGGTLEGKRYVSEAAIEQMSRKQTGPTLSAGYGLGWFTGEGKFGHGGAYATQMNLDPHRNLIAIFLVQQSGSFPNDGDKAFPSFTRAAESLSK